MTRSLTSVGRLNRARPRLWTGLVLLLVGCGGSSDPSLSSKQPAANDTVVESAQVAVEGESNFVPPPAAEPADSSTRPTASTLPNPEPPNQAADRPMQNRPPAAGQPYGPVRAAQANESAVTVAMFLQAALQGEMETIRQALREGMEVDASDAENRTALMFAAFNGHTPIVRLLLRRGAKVDHRDRSGRTALLFASTGNNVETVEALLDAGADVNVADQIEGFTSLMHAAAEGQSSIVRLLLDRQADPSLEDVDGDTARDFAERNGHTRVVDLLSR